MTVRQATYSDIPDIMAVMQAARGIMRASGNMGQWAGGYPDAGVIGADIDALGGYVLLQDGRIAGYFAFLPSPEPTYGRIYEGAWLDDTRPYHVVHRIGSYPEAHGAFDTMLSFCLGIDGNLRIDTHRDNHIMQHLLTSRGFTYCGIIYLASGDERLAYQRL